VLFQAQNALKPVFGRRSASDPTGGAYDGLRSADPWSDGEGTPLLIPLLLEAFGVFISAPWHFASYWGTLDFHGCVSWKFSRIAWAAYRLQTDSILPLASSVWHHLH